MKKYLCFAAIAGATGVLLGAFGAHGLADTLMTRNTTHTWETAVLYQLIHALALLGVGLHMGAVRERGSAWYSRAFIFWALGILFFSGSLYWLAIGGPRWLGPVTPLGGLALILGWVFIGLGAFNRGSSADK
ncbi:MAG: hypothetical protein K0R17_470 [Rariglobus sp.]|jgi:uncharacterized membrane protein YgdD (TMEM256/DUF423 family)|nr:hypothetical protein [Rariglobus sp.]